MALSVEVERLRIASERMGLALNESKCEIITHTTNLPLPASISRFTVTDMSAATLLGSPLLVGPAMDRTLESQVASLKTASSRLGLLQSHDALVILKHSLSLPKLLHNLRSSFCANHQALLDFDESFATAYARS